MAVESRLDSYHRSCGLLEDGNFVESKRARRKEGRLGADLQQSARLDGELTADYSSGQRIGLGDVGGREISEVARVYTHYRSAGTAYAVGRCQERAVAADTQGKRWSGV